MKIKINIPFIDKQTNKHKFSIMHCEKGLKDFGHAVSKVSENLDVVLKCTDVKSPDMKKQKAFTTPTKRSLDFSNGKEVHEQ